MNLVTLAVYMSCFLYIYRVPENNVMYASKHTPVLLMLLTSTVMSLAGLSHNCPSLVCHMDAVKRAVIQLKGHGKSSPYCKLAVVKADQQVKKAQRDLAYWRKHGDHELAIFETEVKDGTLDPEWNQTFSM